MKNDWTAMGEGDGQFPLTRLTLLRNLRAASPEKRREALGAFWQSYWKPLYAYARGQGLSNEAAKDLVQSFCARAIEKDLLDRFEPARGRLRTWMLRCFHSFLVDRVREDHAQRRGGGRAAEPIGMAADVEARSPAAIEFDREWAMGLIERAFARLREVTQIRWPDGWRGKLLALLQEKGYGALPPVRELARRLEVTEAQVRHFIHRDAKVELRSEIRWEIEQGTRAAETEEELDYLLGFAGES